MEDDYLWPDISVPIQVLKILARAFERTSDDGRTFSVQEEKDVEKFFGGLPPGIKDELKRDN